MTFSTVCWESHVRGKTWEKFQGNKLSSPRQLKNCPPKTIEQWGRKVRTNLDRDKMLDFLTFRCCVCCYLAPLMISNCPFQSLTSTSTSPVARIVHSLMRWVTLMFSGGFTDSLSCQGSSSIGSNSCPSGQIKEDLRTPPWVSWLWADITSLLSRGRVTFYPLLRSIFWSLDIWLGWLAFRFLWYIVRAVADIDVEGAEEAVQLNQPAPPAPH